MRSLKVLLSYPEVMNYLSKKYKTDLAIVRNNVATLRYVQLSNMAPQQYADDLIAKSCKVVDVYYESTLNDVFIEGFDAGTKHSLRNYRITNSQEGITDIAFQAESLLTIRKGSGENLTNSHASTNSEKLYNRKPYKSRSIASNINRETRWTPTQKTRRRSPSSQALDINASSILSSRQSSARSSSSTMPSINPSFCKVCYVTSHLMTKCSLLTQDSFAQLATIRLRNMQIRQRDNAKNAKIDPLHLGVAVFVTVSVENRHLQTGTPAHLKRMKTVLVRLPRKT